MLKPVYRIGDLATGSNDTTEDLVQTSLDEALEEALYRNSWGQAQGVWVFHGDLIAIVFEQSVFLKESQTKTPNNLNE